MLSKQKQRIKRHRRVRAKIRGTGKRPRLCVFRSNKNIYAQLIDDTTGSVMASSSGEKSIKSASKVGKLIGEKAGNKKIGRAVFDRGRYKYHGRVKALAEGAKEGGLKF